MIPAARAVSSAGSVARSASSGSSALSLAVGIITPLLFSALDYLEDSRASASAPATTYELAPDPVAPNIIDECDADIVNKFPPGCKFERHYPVPGEKDWYLELNMPTKATLTTMSPLSSGKKTGETVRPGLT